MAITPALLLVCCLGVYDGTRIRGHRVIMRESVPPRVHYPPYTVTSSSNPPPLRLVVLLKSGHGHAQFMHDIPHVMLRTHAVMHVPDTGTQGKRRAECLLLLLLWLV
jgi:hypothetical protein